MIDMTDDGRMARMEDGRLDDTTNIQATLPFTSHGVP